MSYSTFNGASIIPMPTSPAPKDITVHMNDTVGSTESPFTRWTQTQSWIGGDFWEIEVNLPPMNDRETRPWLAWLASLRGKANVFQLGDPLGTHPQGAANGVNPSLALYGPIIPRQSVIALRNFSSNTNGVLWPGDYIQIGYRLHMIAGVSPLNSDASGVVSSVEIWPVTRDAQADGTIVGIYNTTGIWRLQDNKRDWTAVETQLYGVSFKAVEAR